MTPKVSIIIPVFNTEKYLKKCLDSVLNQTLSSIEVICINDCSEDNSLEILKEYSNKDKRLKLIDFKVNQGVSIARNKGVSESSGDYIGFIDSDDFVELDFYEKLYKKAIETNADCAKGNIYTTKEDGSNPILTDFYNQNNKIKENKAYFCYGFTSAIYKASLIKDNNINFPEKIIHFEDPYFSILANIFMTSVEIVNSAKYYYIQHKNSAVDGSKTEKAAIAFKNSVAKITDLINKNCSSKTDYNIYFNFLLTQLVPWCSDTMLTDKANSIAIEGLLYIFKNIKYDKQKLFEFYFLNKKNETLKNNRKAAFEKLRKKISINSTNNIT